VGVEKTFVAIKPDGVARGLIGEILRRFENSGLKIVAMRMVWVPKEHAQKHYEEHVAKPFFSTIVDYIHSGPVVAMVIEGVDAIEVVRKMIGGTEPKSALPGTIRGDYSHHSYQHTDANKRPIMNLIHASANKKDAEREILLWFKSTEIHDYKTIHETYTF
jgi:nucleoside-diphosphate kinase